MRYKEQIREYQAKGLGSEKKMWEAICELDEAMECLKEKIPTRMTRPYVIYMRFLRSSL